MTTTPTHAQHKNKQIHHQINKTQQQHTYNKQYIYTQHKQTMTTNTKQHIHNWKI